MWAERKQRNVGWLDGWMEREETLGLKNEVMQTTSLSLCQRLSLKTFTHTSINAALTFVFPPSEQ